ncbi:thioesterase family protein [Snodgrassella sp. CFCC 13594]|uniref:acyl-CoA thioesterase n=1 Tax=Snodgrassella sp. CFCC 13594 TaxID=1775559 RepID=UPI0008318274|nr:thioesterase family protein [Snodgrassella sp. CFCC 13594]
MHQTHIRVRGYHLDVFQHVNNARYLEFLEEARWSYFEDTGLTPLFLEAGYGMAVVNININYRHGARINDDLVIETRFTEIHQRNAVLSQIITLKNTDKVVADATIVFVAFDPHTNKAIAFDGPLKSRLADLVSAAS